MFYRDYYYYVIQPKILMRNYKNRTISLFIFISPFYISLIYLCLLTYPHPTPFTSSVTLHFIDVPRVNRPCLMLTVPVWCKKRRQISVRRPWQQTRWRIPNCNCSTFQNSAYEEVPSYSFYYCCEYYKREKNYGAFPVKRAGDDQSVCISGGMCPGASQTDFAVGTLAIWGN